MTSKRKMRRSRGNRRGIINELLTAIFGYKTKYDKLIEKRNRKH